MAHSLSPLIHNTGYSAAGLIGWHYTAHECREADLPGFLAGLGSDWAGVSLTMPLKTTAVELAGEVTDIAAALGAANTLVLRDGVCRADNTDAPGMVDALAEAGVAGVDRVAILGAGGTARAALGAAASLRAGEVTMYARREAAVAELAPVADRLGLSLRHGPWDSAAAAADADLVVSTMPKGVCDPLARDWQGTAALFEVLYDPWPTPLASAAQTAGAVVVDGLALLLAQAVRQFEQFTGVVAPRDAMRATLYHHVGVTV